MKLLRSAHARDQFHRSGRRAIYATAGGILILVSLIAGALLHFSDGKRESADLSLNVEKNGNELHVTWDGTSPALQQATGAPTVGFRDSGECFLKFRFQT